MIRLPRAFAPLRHRNYALYFYGFAASNSGKWIEQTGAVWLVYELAESPLLLGLLGVARAIPLVVLSPIAGVIVDRVDQRRLLLVTQALALVASLSLGFLVVTGLVELWHVYLQVFVQAAIASFDWAVRQALFPRLVPRGQLAEVVTLQSTVARFSSLVGPAVGGFAIASFGEAAPFFLNGVTFLVLIAAVLRMRGVEGAIVRTASSFRVDLVDGMRHILGHPVLSRLLRMELVFSLFQINPVIIAIVGREVLGVGPEGLGGLLSASALGALIGITFLLALGPPARQGRFVVFCTFAYAASFLVMAVAWDYAIAFVAIALTGCFDALVTVTRNTIAQHTAPAHMRGRIMANMATVTRGLGPLSETQSGALAGAVGVPLAVTGAAIALAAIGGSMARPSSALWRFTRETEADDGADVRLADPPAVLEET
jgi:MFS family permease